MLEKQKEAELRFVSIPFDRSHNLLILAFDHRVWFKLTYNPVFRDS